MSVPTIHITPDELHTDRFWIERLNPITRAAALPDPTHMVRDVGDPGTHLLMSPTGELLAVVRTDRLPCPTCGR